MTSMQKAALNETMIAGVVEKWENLIVQDQTRYEKTKKVRADHKRSAAAKEKSLARQVARLYKQAVADFVNEDVEEEETLSRVRR